MNVPPSFFDDFLVTPQETSDAKGLLWLMNVGPKTQRLNPIYCYQCQKNLPQIECPKCHKRFCQDCCNICFGCGQTFCSSCIDSRIIESEEKETTRYYIYSHK